MHKSKRNTSLFLAFFMILLTLNVSAYSAKPGSSTLSAPTGLKAAGVAETEIALSWTAVKGAAGYKLYAATPQDGGHALVATIAATTFKHTGLKPNASYWYYVTAYKGNLTSGESVHLNVITKSVVQPTPTPTPTPTPEPTPTPVPQEKQVLGFATYYYTGDKSSYNSMVTNTAAIDEVITHTFVTDGAGTLTGLIPSEQITYANNNGIKLLASVVNDFNGNVAKTLLESAENRQNLIQNIVSSVKANNYKGVSIDFEGVYAANRSHLTAFMQELYSTMKPQGYDVALCVPAKTADNPAYTWNYAYDYTSLASHADQLVIMAYDEHYPGGTPGPVASVNWVQNVMKYAATAIPKEKLFLGVAAYGYDWWGSNTKAYSISSIYGLAADNNAQIQWDSVSKSPYFTYRDAYNVDHTVWFENAESVQYKLDIVNSGDLAGIALWRLGLENADYWTSIKSKLNK